MTTIERYASRPYVPNYNNVMSPDDHIPGKKLIRQQITGWSPKDSIERAHTAYSLLPPHYERQTSASVTANAIEIPSTINKSYVPYDQMVTYVASSNEKHYDVQNTGGIKQVHLDSKELQRLQAHIERERKRVEHCHEMPGLFKV